MNDSSKCPDDDTLVRLMLGTLPGSEADVLIHHVDTCQQCVANAETLLIEDELTEIIRRPAGSDSRVNPLQRDHEAVSIAIERIKKAHNEMNTVVIADTVAGDGGTSGLSATSLKATPEDGSFDASFLDPPQEHDEIGRLGSYRILDLLGAGGMGMVFRAEDTRLRRIVAIKTMKPTIASNRDAKARFLREARATAAVEHENVVPIYEVEDEGGVPYYAMQFLKGESLQDRLRTGEKLSSEAIQKVAVEVAAGLAAAHEQGLIHRDIKPDNIWLDEVSGRARILDFGLVSQGVGDEGLTHTGIMLGTPSYMSPEQAQGGSVDGRSDLFNLGSVLYLMVTGKLPFSGDTLLATLYAVVHHQPPEIDPVPHGVSPNFAKAIMQLLEKKPANRPQSAKELIAILITCDAKHPNDVSVVPSLPPSTPVHRNHWAIGFGGFGLILLAGLIIITIKHRDGTQTEIQSTNADSVRIESDQATTIEIKQALEEPSKPALSTIEPWKGLDKDAPKLAVAPFDADQARVYQKAWSDHLQVPIEFTNSIDMQFVLIPPCQFLMGSSQSEINEASAPMKEGHWLRCIESEGPAHPVVITKAFYMGKYEVTQKQFLDVMEYNPAYFQDSQEARSRMVGLRPANHPVETVTWDEAAEFCARLSKQEGQPSFYSLTSLSSPMLKGSGYRLPTEAEWEFACRAGTTTKYWSGDSEDSLKNAGWLGPNSKGRTHAVGELRPNAFGLFDTHGNVWEWVQDRWDPDFFRKHTEPPYPDPCCQDSTALTRIFRGSGWRGQYLHSRSSSRYAPEKMYSNFHIGFRVTLTTDAVAQAVNLEK